MYSGTKIGKYNGGTFTEQPFAGEQSSKNLLERVCTILFQARLFVHFDFRAEIQVFQEDFQTFGLCGYMEKCNVKNPYSAVIVNFVITYDESFQNDKQFVSLFGFDLKWVVCGGVFFPPLTARS